MDYSTKPIQRRSKKRAAAERQYSKQRAIFLQTHDRCKMGHYAFMPCSGELTVHHQRGRIGDLLLDEKFWIALCMGHHEFVETHPMWAKENGFSLSRLSKD